MEESGQIVTMIRKSTSLGDVSTWMYYAMILLVVSLPLSEFGMSVAQFLLLGLWIYEGADFSGSPESNNSFIRHLRIIGKNLAGKFRIVFSNKVLLIFISIYIFHLVALSYTSDFNYGLKDIRVKLPLLSLPVILATSRPLNLKQFYTLLLLFTLGVITGTLASIYALLTRTINDPREISIFISHIRFALFISFSIFILGYFLYKNVFKNAVAKILTVLAIGWLMIFLFILKSLTGIIISSLLLVVVLFNILLKNRRLIIPAIILILAMSAGATYYISNVFKDITVAKKVNWESLDKYTALGNPYRHDTLNYGIEYGSYVGMYLSTNELRESWNKRSNFKFDSLDNKGQQLEYTLIRYLHSKGYRKDASGVSKLTADEIQQIENGIANVNYLNRFDLRTRVDQILQGYKTYRVDDDPNASSFMQRIEYWKTSIWLITEKPLFGYGTGDVRKSFDLAYDKTNSKLLPEFRHRSHNQFLAITIAFGVAGLLVFIASLLYPPILLGKFKEYLYSVFFFIAVFSFLTEDTLETQAGATFYAFFSALLLFNIRKETYKKLENSIANQ